jgi:hypothetical protein
LNDLWDIKVTSVELMKFVKEYNYKISNDTFQYALNTLNLELLMFLVENYHYAVETNLLNIELDS